MVYISLLFWALLSHLWFQTRNVLQKGRGSIGVLTRPHRKSGENLMTDCISFVV